MLVRSAIPRAKRRVEFRRTRSPRELLSTLPCRPVSDGRRAPATEARSFLARAWSRG